MMTFLISRFFISCTYAFVLTNVSRPVASATILRAGTPAEISHARPDAASVVRSPGARDPTVIIIGARPRSKILFASVRRASKTSPGRPSNWAAPITTMASAPRTTG